ncbi:MAG TPA: ATP-binding protein, partial [Spirochaetota bacterium]
SYALAAMDNERQRQLAETALKQVNEELELKVKSRTAELMEINKELEAFSYSVSHDLRSPLSHITKFIELLQLQLGDRADETTDKYMNIILKSSKKMAVLIEHLLAFSRLGTVKLKKTRISFNTLVKEVIDEVVDEAKCDKIKFKVDELPEVQGDPALMKQVFLNLISNAIKFTDRQDFAEITIGCNEEKEEFIFFVRDNGVGFNMEYAHKLFGVFSRLHTQSEFEGTGIGLANVKRIILRHGGRVWAESSAGQGAIFYFSLPRLAD